LLLLIGLAVAILIVLARRGGPIGPLSSGNFSALAYNIALVVFVAGTVLTLFRERFMQAITTALVWIVVGLVLVAAYTYRFELQEIGNRVLAELVPGHVISNGRTVAVAPGISPLRQRSTAPVSPWCSIPAPAP
jgi:aspartyl protease family protein